MRLPAPGGTPVKTTRSPGPTDVRNESSLSGDSMTLSGSMRFVPVSYTYPLVAPEKKPFAVTSQLPASACPTIESMVSAVAMSFLFEVSTLT
jgi:hypothetical protein